MAEFKLNKDVGTSAPGNDDTNILNICKLLTNKGYVTKASCEGHPNNAEYAIRNDCIYAMLCPYISFANKYDFKTLPKGWYKDSDNVIRVRDSICKMELRKASPEEKESFKNIINDSLPKISSLGDKEKLKVILEKRKNIYMSALESWAKKLPIIDKNNTMTEATTNSGTSKNAQKRKEITEFIRQCYTSLEKGGTKNFDKFIENTSKMSDAKFIALMTSIVNDPKKHLYFEIEEFKDSMDYETIEKTIYDVIGDDYCHLYDYIVRPDLSSDPKHPKTSVNKIFNGYLNMRRVQQMVNHKNHIPTSTERRDPKTNQVAFESKAARISDTEQFGMICQGIPHVLKEMFGPRGGDPVMRDQMTREIATTGTTRLAEMTDSKLNKTSLNTANVYLLGAGIESDLITKNGILPRTIEKRYAEANTLQRKEGQNK